MLFLQPAIHWTKLRAPLCWAFVYIVLRRRGLPRFRHKIYLCLPCGHFLNRGQSSPANTTFTPTIHVWAHPLGLRLVWGLWTPLVPSYNLAWLVRYMFNDQILWQLCVHVHGPQDDHNQNYIYNVNNRDNNDILHSGTNLLPLVFSQFEKQSHGTLIPTCLRCYILCGHRFFKASLNFCRCAMSHIKLTTLQFSLTVKIIWNLAPTESLSKFLLIFQTIGWKSTNRYWYFTWTHPFM